MESRGLRGWDLTEIERPWARVRGTYWLIGPDLDPDVITDWTGLAPDTVGRVGDRKPNGNVFTRGSWGLRSRAPSTASFADHVEALVERLRPSWTVFASLGRQHAAWIDIAINMNHGPSVELPPPLALALAELNATLVVGLGLYAPDAEPE